MSEDCCSRLIVFLLLSACILLMVFATFFFSPYFGLIVNVCCLRSSCECLMMLVPVHYHITGSVLGCSQRCQFSSFQSSEKMSSLPNPVIHSTIWAVKPSILGFALKCLMKMQASISLLIFSLDCARGHVPGSCSIPVSLAQDIQASCFLLQPPTNALMHWAHRTALSLGAQLTSQTCWDFSLASR